MVLFEEVTKICLIFVPRKEPYSVKHSELSLDAQASAKKILIYSLLHFFVLKRKYCFYLVGNH